MRNVMKNFILCFMLLFLTACIPVDDFGAYWHKGVVDQMMIGKWRKVSGKDHVEVKVTLRNGMVRIDSMDEKERKSKDYQPLFARTLKAGRYTYLMAKSVNSDGRESNDLVRYQIKGDKLVEYSLSDRKAIEFLRKEYPNARNIGVPACKGECVLGSIRIRTLDDETVRILANIPNSPEFWSRAEKWKRQP